MLRRKIPLNYRNITGVAHSREDGIATPFESPLERDFIELLRFDAFNIRSYKSQMPIIHYLTDSGKKRKYTPDIFVEYRDGRKIMYEVKTRENLKSDWLELKPKFKQAIRYGKLHGYRFKIVTEMEIRTPFLKNVKFLDMFLSTEEYDPRYKWILNRLETLRESTPDELIKALAKSKHSQMELLHTIWRMVADRLIGVDMQIPIRMDSKVWYRLREPENDQ